MSGKINEVDAEARMIDIEDECGSIPVMAPIMEIGPGISFETCRAGVLARATGSIFIVAVEANELLCR